MKVLIDMNLSPAWVRFLVEAGIEAIHWSDVGPETASDNELLGWAADHGCIVLTADLDFGAILAASHSNRPSVVQIRSDVLTPQIIGEKIIAAMRQASEELREGALISVDADRARLRILPFKDA